MDNEKFTTSDVIFGIVLVILVVFGILFLGNILINDMVSKKHRITLCKIIYEKEEDVNFCTNKDVQTIITYLGLIINEKGAEAPNS